jgi:hypothetical protein
MPGINLRGPSAAVLGSRFVDYMAFDRRRRRGEGGKSDQGRHGGEGSGEEVEQTLEGPLLAERQDRVRGVSGDLREDSLELRVSITVTANVSRDLPRQGRP